MGREETAPEERVGMWASRNVLPVERCLQVLADVKAGETSDLATLSVAVRELRNLIQSTTAVPVELEPVSAGDTVQSAPLTLPRSSRAPAP